MKLVGVYRITSNNTVTIPLEVREELGLNPGDRVAYMISDDGHILITNPNKDIDKRDEGKT